MMKYLWVNLPMCIVCSPRMRKDATKLYAKRQISCEFTVSQCSPLCPSRKKQAPFYYRGVVIQKRRIKKKIKRWKHIFLLLSLCQFFTWVKLCHRTKITQIIDLGQEKTRLVVSDPLIVQIIIEMKQVNDHVWKFLSSWIIIKCRKMSNTQSFLPNFGPNQTVKAAFRAW